MTHLRTCPLSGRTTLLSTTRHHRPHDYRVEERRLHDVDCPFCPGSGADTEQERSRLTSPDGARWSVRIVDNRYPAVMEDARAATAPADDHPLFPSGEACGRHEVVIESPVHEHRWSTMGEEHLSGLLQVVGERVAWLCGMAGAEHVTWFRNSGSLSGGSLRHPHSQLIATPFVPAHVGRRAEGARRWWSDHGTGYFEQLVAAELERGVRVVAATRHFVLLAPWAPRQAHETVVLPLRRQPRFGALPHEERRDLARLLHRASCAYERAFSLRGMNVVLQQAPIGAADAADFWCWHLELIPRNGAIGGLELGTGTHLVSTAPEESARILRAGLAALAQEVA
ncbi:MAG: DUF4931 domain-containing protein [Deltaproteobacteria bacterium]|nr:MAG: DUF4931 domain-containing protein [Deltaproteobacteria bacterium]